MGTLNTCRVRAAFPSVVRVEIMGGSGHKVTERPTDDLARLRMVAKGPAARKLFLAGERADLMGLPPEVQSRVAGLPALQLGPGGVAATPDVGNLAQHTAAFTPQAVSKVVAFEAPTVAKS